MTLHFKYAIIKKYLLFCERRGFKHGKKKNSMIRREIVVDKKRTYILVVLLLLLAVFAPLKSFISKWLLDSTSKDEVFAYLVKIPLNHKSTVTEIAS